jgi:hypothetical protein
MGPVCYFNLEEVVVMQLLHHLEYGCLLIKPLYIRDQPEGMVELGDQHRGQ